MMSRSQYIRSGKGLILVTRGGGLPSKSASQTRAAQRIRPMQSLKGISAVQVYQTAPEKREALSRYHDPPITGSLLLHRAGYDILIG